MHLQVQITILQQAGVIEFNNYWGVIKNGKLF